MAERNVTAGWDCPRLTLALLLLIGSAILLFARLGHYALWDDEAIIGLSARGVWQTGDTTVKLGHNVVGYQGGILIHHWHDRSTPPLPAYLAAPFSGLGGASALAVRLPFAMLGWLSVVLIVWWLRAANAPLRVWAFTTLAVLGNVSFFLFSRNCRYYAPAIFFSLAIAYLYVHRRGTRREQIAMVVCSLALLATHYLNYVALYVCLFTDYALWGRHNRRFSRREWCLLLLPQVVLGAAIVLIWNTMRTGNSTAFFANSLGDKLQLFGWMCRDANASELGVGGLLLAAPCLYFLKRDPWLLRAPLLLLVYLGAMCLLAPTVVAGRFDADIRYLTPLIPLGIAIAVLALQTLATRFGTATALGIAGIAFGTNILNGGPLQRCGTSAPAQFLRNLTWTPRSEPVGTRSTLWVYIHELITPLPDPYRVAIDWVNRHIQANQSIAVQPAYMMYPLMYHAPQACYAWQFANPPAPQFEGLPPIHYEGRALPDYFVVFGPVLTDLMALIDAQLVPRGIRYRQMAALDTYWRDGYRPELIWRIQEPITNYDPATEAIYILQRERP